MGCIRAQQCAEHCWNICFGRELVKQLLNSDLAFSLRSTFRPGSKFLGMLSNNLFVKISFFWFEVAPLILPWILNFEVGSWIHIFLLKLFAEKLLVKTCFKRYWQRNFWSNYFKNGKENCGENTFGENICRETSREKSSKKTFAEKLLEKNL